jgi:hypothetical protein
MNEYKSVQDLIVKAALRDKVTTTIRAEELVGGMNAISVTFSKEDRRSSTIIDLCHSFSDEEDYALSACKYALHELLWNPYNEIETKRRNNNGPNN